MYYESHVTIEPVFDEQLDNATTIAIRHNFKIANLLMQKREADAPERSKHDTFMTGHSPTTVGGLDDINIRTMELIADLKSNGFKVWRYKIEHAIIDSRNVDIWELI
jgi:hypothetical protein